MRIRAQAHSPPLRIHEGLALTEHQGVHDVASELTVPMRADKMTEMMYRTHTSGSKSSGGV